MVKEKALVSKILDNAFSSWEISNILEIEEGSSRYKVIKPAIKIRGDNCHTLGRITGEWGCPVMSKTISLAPNSKTIGASGF
jgi:hypothetical protein